jgi:hypothetical protein
VFAQAVPVRALWLYPGGRGLVTRAPLKAAASLDLTKISPEPTEWDQRAYEQITSTQLTPEQVERVATPAFEEPKQTEILAVHWHPEFVPMEVVLRRVRAMFPNAERELIIPTQHNILLEHDGLAGVEIDCYSVPFARKVQLLAHFDAERVRDADAFKAMLAHTFKYRAGQLFEFIDSVIDPAFEERVERAAAQTGAPDEVVRFTRLHVEKLKRLIDANWSTTPQEQIKNKIIRNYFHTLRDHYDEQIIQHAQAFLKAVKQLVKKTFALTYFYKTQEIIEEVRGLGGGVIIPHPEQFWPILLADYDVDGIEVWNPQSREYTEFLINVVNRENKAGRFARPLLITMGDDTHFGEKVLDPEYQDAEKAGRELGYQPAWDDVGIRKNLAVAGMDRGRVIEEYKQRLGG